MYLNETDNEVRIAKNLSNMFYIQNSLEKDDLSPFISGSALE
jgi:hypothetical protein